MDRSPRRELTLHALVFLLFIALTALITYPQVRHLSTGVNDPGDPLLNVWAIAWIAHQLPFAPGHIFDANIFHPERRTLAYSEALLVPGIMAAPIIWSGGGPVLAYNLLFLSGFVLSGVGTFVLVRSLTGRIDAAILSGIFFAFQPYRIDHYPHLQMQMTQFMPLALWALHRTIAAGRIRDGLLTGLFVACNALSCLYFGVFFTAAFAVIAGVLLFGHGRASWRRPLLALAIGAVLSAALAQPTARAYLRNQRTVGERSQGEAELGSAEPRNYLSPSANNLLYGDWRRFGKSEARLFPGILVVALALVGVWPPLSVSRVAYVMGLLFAFDVSLGYNGYLYRVLYDFVLPFRALRVPARMGIIVGLFLSILAGYGSARIFWRMPSRGARALAVAFGIIAIVEYRNVPLRLYDVPRTMPSVYDWLADQPDDAVLELPLDGDDSKDPLFMYFSTRHWKPILNGYSGFFPRSYMEVRQVLETFPDPDSVKYLQRRRVRYVIVHQQFYDHDVYERLIDAMNATPEFAHVMTSKWEGADVRLYRLRRMGGQ